MKATVLDSFFLNFVPIFCEHSCAVLALQKSAKPWNKFGIRKLDFPLHFHPTWVYQLNFGTYHPDYAF